MNLSPDEWVDTVTAVAQCERLLSVDWSVKSFGRCEFCGSDATAKVIVTTRVLPVSGFVKYDTHKVVVCKGCFTALAKLLTEVAHPCHAR
jgi:hypothetical protein